MLASSNLSQLNTLLHKCLWKMYKPLFYKIGFGIKSPTKAFDVIKKLSYFMVKTVFNRHFSKCNSQRGLSVALHEIV